jgi:hypothetical protein
MPYTPTVQDRTGEFLMRGITGAADSLAQGIKDYRQNKQEHGGLVSLVENKVKTSPGLVEKYGDKLAKAPAMSLSQLKALNSSLDLEMQNQRFEQERKFKEEDLNLRKAYKDMQEQQLVRANQRDAAGQRFTERLASLSTAGGAPSMDFANTLAGEPMPTRELGFTDIMQAAAQSGLALDPERLAPLMRADAMDRRQDRPQWGGPDIKTLTNPVTGEKVPVFLGGPNQASLMPSGEMNANQRSQALLRLRSERRRLIAARAEAFDTSEKQEITNELRALDRDIQEMGGAEAPTEAGAAAGETPEQIRDLMRSGKLSRDEAVKKLRALGFK